MLTISRTGPYTIKAENLQDVETLVFRANNPSTLNDTEAAALDKRNEVLNLETRDACEGGPTNYRRS